MIVSKRDFVGVSQQFLRKDHFRKGCQIMLKRKVIFKELVEFLIKVYELWIKFATQSANIGIKQFQKCSFRWFKDMMDDKVFKICLNIMSFQQKQLKKVIEENRQSYKSLDAILNSVSTYSEAQDSYKSLILNIRKLVEQQEKQILINSQTTDQILSLFSESQQIKNKASLGQKIKQIDNLMQQSQSQLMNLQLQRATFIDEALKFRSTLCSNRGHILQRFKQTSQHSISGFQMMFIALKQNLKSNKVYLLNKTVYVQDHEKSAAESQRSCRLNTQDNCSDILALMKYLKQITSIMKIFCQQFSESVRKIEGILLDSIIMSFHVSQSSFQNVTNLLDTLKNVSVRMENIYSHINQKYEKLQGSTKNLQKLFEIATSRNNCMLRTPSKDFDRDKKQTKMNIKAEKLKNQINYDQAIRTQQINTILNEILKVIQEESEVFVVWTQSKKLNISSLSNVSIESLNNSSILSLGASIQEVKEIWIKPVEQLWLWQDWKDEETYKIERQKLEIIKQNFLRMNTHDVDIKIQPKKIWKCTCLLTNEEGQLQLREKILRFASEKYTGRVPYTDIQKVFIKSIRDKEILYIMSKKGLLRFENLENPVEVKHSIKEKMQRCFSPKFVSRISKSFKNYQPGYISVQQNNQINSDTRTGKMQSLLPNLLDHTLVLNTHFEDTTLVTFFRQCLSDAEVNVNGVTYQNVIAYAFSKNVTSMTQTKWNPQPPTYFTGLNGNPITSKLLYSQKIVQYQQKTSSEVLKFPQILHIKNYFKLFWVNKERIVVQTKMFHTNSPYANDYAIQIVFDVFQNNRNIELKCYKKVTVLKQFHEKEVLTSLIKSGLDNNIKEYMRAIATKLGDPLMKFNFLIEEQKNNVQDPKPKTLSVQDSPDPLKIIVIVFGTLLLIWVMNKVF